MKGCPISRARTDVGPDIPGKKPFPKLTIRKDTNMKLFLSFILAVLGSSGIVRSATADLVVADFEGANYGGWTVAGEAFGTGPARGALPNQMPVQGYLGQGLANSFVGGDDSTGTLTSPTFQIERRYLRFLIGGGGYAGETCLNLRVHGRAVRTAAGPNTQPGGSERLDWMEWDVTEFAGSDAVLEIVDQRTGGWGHINVDQIVQTDRPLPRMLTDVSREILVAKRFLNLPVKNGAPKRWVRLLVDGRLEREFEIELADDAPDWWAFLELAPFGGKRVVIRVDQLREDSQALASIEQADTIKGNDDLYREKLRPQFHFTSRRGWNNDPNGLVYYQGEFHLFYQHNPFGWNWGNMHWGHAVSPDLVRWIEIEEALYPDDMGTMFSDSAVVDWPNTAGFARGNEPALVAIYTAAGGTSPRSKGQPFTQCIAYSTDRGRSWTKYAGNPVLPHIVGGNRDPKVIWYAPENKWIMALYLDQSDFALFDSPDLKTWRRLSDVQLPGTSECPEFFEIPVEGEQNKTSWAFYGGDGRYLIGGFDGATFTSQSELLSLNFGNCFYASQTYSDIPAHDGRRILVAWGRVNLPGMPFNQMMDFPVELTLRNTDDGPRLCAWPVREIESLWLKKHEWDNFALAPGHNPLADLRGELFDIEATFDMQAAEAVTVEIRGVNVAYDVDNQELSCLDRSAMLKPESGTIHLRLLVDRASIEIFGNEGRVYMPMGVIPDESNKSLGIFARSGAVEVRDLSVRELRSAWER